jgi:hypothetical protein
MTNREDHKKRKIPGKDRPKEREVDRRWEVCEWEGWVWEVKMAKPREVKLVDVCGARLDLMILLSNKRLTIKSSRRGKGSTCCCLFAAGIKKGESRGVKMSRWNYDEYKKPITLWRKLLFMCRLGNSSEKPRAFASSFVLGLFYFV